MLKNQPQLKNHSWTLEKPLAFCVATAQADSGFFMRP